MTERDLVNVFALGSNPHVISDLPVYEGLGNPNWKITVTFDESNYEF